MGQRVHLFHYISRQCFSLSLLLICSLFVLNLCLISDQFEARGFLKLCLFSEKSVVNGRECAYCFLNKTPGCLSIA